MAAYNDSKDHSTYSHTVSVDSKYYDQMFEKQTFNIDGKIVSVKIMYDEDRPDLKVFVIACTYNGPEVFIDDTNVDTVTLNDYVNISKLVKGIKEFCEIFYRNIGDFVYIGSESSDENTIINYYRINTGHCVATVCNMNTGCGCCDDE